MATTENTITGNTTTGPHSFTFPYIKADDVKVTKTIANGTETTLTKVASSPGATEYTQATTSITLGAALISSDKLRIYRSTSDSDITATFYPGSAIRSADLNDNFTQNLYSTQENTNEAASATTTADAAVVTADAATATANTASTNASAAVSTANTATTTANSAVTTANSATTTANSAVTTANAATTTANTASTNATTAVNTANAATTTANAAFQRDGSATMTGNIVFEGATDDANETTLTVVDPTADRTITLPNQSGTVPVLAAASNTQVTSTPEELNILDGVTSTAAELNILDGVTSTAAELNILDGVTSTAAELNILDGVTSTAAELNLLDGVTSTTAELNYVDGVTSNVQTQLNAKQPLDADLTTLAGMQSGTASILASGTALTSTTAELNLLDGKSVVTAVSGSSTDVQLPTAKAVNDQIVALMQDAGGFHPILDDQKFPNTNPDPNDDAGTIVSIADAGGLVVNGSGVSTTGRTLGGSTVTINGIDSTLYSTTIAAGKGMLVQTTSTLNTYDYHRLVVDEAGVAGAQTLVSDFNERYRVNAGEPSSHLTDGDLVFDTSANKMKVYDSSASAWKEVTSAGDFKYLFLCPAGGTGAPTINGSIATYDLREGSNSGSAASVTSAAQLMVSVNGVVQQANTGTSAPSLGFALVDSNTIIFGANLPTSAEVFIVQSGSALTITTPGDNTVSAAKIQSGAVETAKIANDAVTADKLANSINTEIAANTAKVTNATHTGDVTGSTALTIATGAVETAMIADDAVTTDKLANAINTSIAAKAPLDSPAFTGSPTFARVTAGTATTTGVYSVNATTNSTFGSGWSALYASNRTAGGRVFGVLNAAVNAETVTILENGEATFAGKITLPTAGTGIQFGSSDTPGGSVLSQTLDDYEEGSWTPALSGDWTSITYNTQRGKYIKIGNMVYIYYTLVIAAATSPGSAYGFSIHGLPFQGYDYLAGYFTGAIGDTNIANFVTDNWTGVWYGGANTSFSFTDFGGNTSIRCGSNITATSHGYISGHLIYSATTF